VQFDKHFNADGGERGDGRGRILALVKATAAGAFVINRLDAAKNAAGAATQSGAGFTDNTNANI
jgi:hypothetical protein